MKRRTIAWMYLCLALSVSALVSAEPAAAPAPPANEELAAHLREYVPQLLTDW